MTVLDASVVVAWALPDEQSDTADTLIPHVERFGSLAPTIWTYEVSSAINIAQRRGRVTRELARIALSAAMELPIEFVHLKADALLELAEATTLSVYDASYLAVCRMHDLPLATLDQRLRNAATDLGIELIA